MKHRLTAAFVLTLALAGTGWAQLAPSAQGAAPAPAAQEQKAVTVALTQQKVVKDEKGRDKLVEAETVKPNDVLEYRAVYKNVSTRPVKQLAATIPLPEGLEYLPTSAQPRKGVQFAPASGAYAAEPLMRKLPNGRSEPLAYSDYRLSDEWSLLARSVYNSSKGVGSNEGNERTLSRQQVGVAYRPTNDDTWNALARYEHKSERIRGSDTTTATMSGNAFGSDNSLPGDYDAHIVSMHVNYNPSAGNTVTGRLAAKYSTYDDLSLKSSYTAQLLYARYTRDLNAKWDLSVQGGLLHGSGGALQKSLGLELGYQVMKDLWFSVGYNAIGLSDRDLTAGEYTSKGAYFRLRFKFDETGLGFERTGSKGGSAPAGSVGMAASSPGSAPGNPIEAPPRIAADAAAPADTPSASASAPAPAPAPAPAAARSLVIPEQTVGSTSGGAGLALSSGRVSAVVNALRTFGNVKLVSNPTLRARSGEPAFVSVGTTYRYVSKITATTTVVQGVSQTSYSTETNSLFSGLMVGLTPAIREDGSIELFVHPLQSIVRSGSLNLVALGGGNSVTLPAASATRSTRMSARGFASVIS